MSLCYDLFSLGLYSELYQPAVYSLKEDGSFEVVDEENSEKVIPHDVMCLLVTLINWRQFHHPLTVVGFYSLH